MNVDALSRIRDARWAVEPILVIRPSMSYVLVGYIYTLLMYLSLILILVAARAEVIASPARLLLVFAVFLIPPTRQAIRYFTTSVTVTLDELSLEYRHGRKKIRTEVFLSQVQRVHVEQGLLQRLSGSGTVYVKRFDEITRITLEHMDNPYKLADLIVARAKA